MSPRARRGRARHAFGSGGDLLPVLTYRPTPVTRQGIKRKPYRSGPKRPLTGRHLRILAVLASEPQGATALGAEVGLSCNQATPALHVLQARGLATRVPEKGWVRNDTA